MEDLLRALLEKNERMLTVLESIDEKLDGLESIHSTLELIESRSDSIDVLSSDVSSIKFSIESLQEDLQWHKELSFAKQLIDAVESVSDAVQKLER